MTNGAAVESRLIALENALAAIERAGAANEWNDIALLEPMLADSLAALKDSEPYASDRLRLKALLGRASVLFKTLATRKAQIQPLVEAFVPADSEPPVPSP